jgi:hypothetical protein
LSSENIGVASATATFGWGLASGLVHMPPSVILTGGSVLSFVGMTQAVKTKLEARRARRKKNKGVDE